MLFWKMSDIFNQDKIKKICKILKKHKNIYFEVRKAWRKRLVYMCTLKS